MKSAKPICKINAATSTSVRSFPCIDDLRFKATKEADAAPVMMMIVHRTDSTGITNKNWTYCRRMHQKITELQY